MKRCIFESINLNEAQYISDYTDNTELSGEQFIVIFEDENNFKDIIHIDDGDMRCMITQVERKIKPTIKR